MAMDKNARDTKRLEIERVFEGSHLAGELMAGAYENLVPIGRQSIHLVRHIEQSKKLWGIIGIEERQCAV